MKVGKNKLKMSDGSIRTFKSEKKRDNFEKALRNFKRRCMREGVLKEFRERRHYVKPSKKRREKRGRKKRGRTM